MDNVDYIPSLRSTCIQGQREEKRSKETSKQERNKDGKEII